MIISHKHKIIFVKCGKVAGTSVEMALRPYLGDDDIVTPVDPIDELFARENGFPNPKNYINSKEYERRVRFGGSRGIFYEHAWAYEIKGLISSKIWDTYFKFAIERDPREKSLSTYYHNRNGIRWPAYRNVVNMAQGILPLSSRLPLAHPSIAKNMSLQRWLQEDRLHTFCDNWCRYTIDDKVIVDRVYNFANLEALVQDLSGIVGESIELPKLKSNFREHRQLTSVEQSLLDRLLDNDIYNREFHLVSRTQR